MSGIGDLASLGITLGAVGSVVGMTKEAMSPILDTTSQIGKTIGNSLTDSWNCSCGQTGITGKFCSECGSKRPEPVTAGVWDCTCGNKGITGKFCSECGAKRPEMNTTWDCTCGNKGITGKFCSECGNRRSE